MYPYVPLGAVSGCAPGAPAPAALKPRDRVRRCAGHAREAGVEAPLRQKKRPQSSSARARSSTNDTLSGPVALPVNAETGTAGYRASARAMQLR